MLAEMGPFPRADYAEALEHCIAYELKLEEGCANGSIPAGQAAGRRVARIACQRALAIVRQPRPLEQHDLDAIHAEVTGIFEQEFCVGSSLAGIVCFTDDFLRNAGGARLPDVREAQRAAYKKLGYDIGPQQTQDA